MEINSTLKNSLAFGIVIFIAVSIYAISSLSDEEKLPPECEDTYVSVETACMNLEKAAISNFQSSIELKVLSHNSDVNGFRLKIYGENGYMPFVIFKNARQSELAQLSIPYNMDLYGKVRKLEVEPIRNVNKEIKYCGLSRGYVYSQEPSLCENI
jgi:hypothetical protein